MPANLTGNMLIPTQPAAAHAHPLQLQGTPDLPDVRTCRRADIKRKHTRRLETQDRRGATVGVGDMVTIDDGANKGKPATVKHVMKGSLFLHSKCAPFTRALACSPCCVSHEQPCLHCTPGPFLLAAD